VTQLILLEATVDASGSVLTLIFSEWVTDADWAADVRLDGIPHGMGFTYSSGTNSNTIVFASDNEKYVVPAKSDLSLQIAAGTIQDKSGNLLDTVMDFPVSNTSEQ